MWFWCAIYPNTNLQMLTHRIYEFWCFLVWVGAALFLQVKNESIVQYVGLCFPSWKGWFWLLIWVYVSGGTTLIRDPCILRVRRSTHPAPYFRITAKLIKIINTNKCFLRQDRIRADYFYNMLYYTTDYNSMYLCHHRTKTLESFEVK